MQHRNVIVSYRPIRGAPLRHADIACTLHTNIEKNRRKPAPSPTNFEPDTRNRPPPPPSSSRGRSTYSIAEESPHTGRRNRASAPGAVRSISCPRILRPQPAAQRPAVTPAASRLIFGSSSKPQTAGSTTPQKGTRTKIAPPHGRGDDSQDRMSADRAHAGRATGRLHALGHVDAEQSHRRTQHPRHLFGQLEAHATHGRILLAQDRMVVVIAVEELR